MDFTINPEITKEFLLEKNTEETYMQFYLDIPIKKGLFRSPLREDKSPTCSFYRNKNGDLIFKDFSGDFSGNFINVVMYKNTCSYHKALKIIASDFGYIKTSYKKTKGVVHKNIPRLNYEEKSEIRVEIKDFTKYELDWWAKYGITLQILNKFRVYSCKTVFINGNPSIIQYKNNLVFGYYQGKEEGKEAWKIYFPKNKNFRFLNNASKSKMQGYGNLPKTGEVLFITKSLKDVMCMYSLNLHAIAPNSENLFVSDKMLDSLKTRFKRIIVMYDNDLPGISNMNKIRKKYPELEYYFIPRKYGVKDFSDAYVVYGKEDMEEYISNKLNLYEKRT